MTPVQFYVKNYPQLTLPVREGMSNDPTYLSIVRRGAIPEGGGFPFRETGQEKRIEVNTPAGQAEVLYLPDREIFEYFVRVLAHRCEPVEVPPSMGAVMISGINNWRRIEAHKLEYTQAGGTNWAEEFKRFTKVPENYKDIVLLVSKGPYSALSAEDAGYEQEEWLELSGTIRMYHELSHFVSRRLFPENKDKLRDEVIADSIGIIAAFGRYDRQLAKKVLGIEGTEYRKGGRLENYTDKEPCETVMENALRQIDQLDAFYQSCEGKGPFECLVMVEEAGIAVNECVQKGTENEGSVLL